MPTTSCRCRQYDLFVLISWGYLCIIRTATDRDGTDMRLVFIMNRISWSTDPPVFSVGSPPRAWIQRRSWPVNVSNCSIYLTNFVFDPTSFWVALSTADFEEWLPRIPLGDTAASPAVTSVSGAFTIGARWGALWMSACNAWLCFIK